ncbi:MAG: InlB B-repeat-containing protein, partial [Acholeplasmataceae bacterium]|nr:InlB B-repeat-containing protein [Acholeplasmataceae bacterium]
APYVIDQDDVKSDAWWTTNINSIAISDLWGLDEHNIFALNHYLVLLKPLIEVTIVYNFDIDGEIIHIRQDEVFDHEAPIVAGYTFVGWYSDSALETSYEENPVIVAPLTIYGKYEVVPASPVSFVTGVDGLSVPTQDINYGELATEPSLDDQMIEGVLKELTGWTLNGEPFSFASPITEAIELVAVWETVEFTVTFDGDNPVLVPYGELVSEPVDVPTHYFSEVTFKEWQLSGTAYDFNQPVISDLSLVSAYNEPVSISIDTVEEFYHMATVESTYNYVLSTNLDFTGYVWNYVNTSFKGNLDGQGYTVSNIQMLGLTGYAGIFPRANGATIRNLVVDGITIQTTARAGVLIGRVENGDTLIENVVVKNSSVEGSDSNGVGGLIGHVSRKTEVYNVAVINTTVSNVDDPNVGGLVGRVDSAPLFADDILISNVQVTTTTTKDSDAGASAFVGYVRDNENSLVSAMRIIILDTTVSGNRSG